jgi:hypothetical protein
MPGEVSGQVGLVAPGRVCRVGSVGSVILGRSGRVGCDRKCSELACNVRSHRAEVGSRSLESVGLSFLLMGLQEKLDRPGRIIRSLGLVWSHW